MKTEMGNKEKMWEKEKKNLVKRIEELNSKSEREEKSKRKEYHRYQGTHQHYKYGISKKT